MGWDNSGSDDPIVAPDVFGCLELPLTVQCFGPAESNYGTKERNALISHVSSEFKMSAPWSDSIKKTFSPIPNRISSSRAHLMGSPFLDIALGISATTVINNLTKSLLDGKTITRDLSDNLQFDDTLPPEDNTNWAQCSSCLKWRRIAWYVDPVPIQDKDRIFMCEMNTWNLNQANCEAPEDFDAIHESCGEDLRKGTVSEMSYLLDSLPKTTLEECPIGIAKDIYCVRNKQWYKAKIIKHIQGAGGAVDKVRVHFQKWNSKFDETIEVDSGRIQRIGVFTGRRDDSSNEVSVVKTTDTVEQDLSTRSNLKDPGSIKKRRIHNISSTGMKNNTNQDKKSKTSM